MRFRSTLKWFVFFLLVIGVGAATVAWWFWKSSDEMLKEALLEKLTALAPECQISLEEARFDWENQSRVYLSGLRLRPKDDRFEFLTIPSAVVTIDGDLLKDEMQIIVRKLEVHDPHIRLIREADGTWNFERLKFVDPASPMSVGFPEFTLNRASIEVLLNHNETSLSTTVSVDRGNLKLIPKARDYYQIEGSAELPSAGLLELSGEWDIARKRWRLDGAMENIAVDKSLLELLTDVSPSSRSKLVTVDQRLQDFANRVSVEPSATLDSVFESNPNPPDFVPERIARGYSPLVQVSHQRLVPVSAENAESLPDFGLTGNINLNFRLSQENDKEPVDYKLLFAISKGQLDNPVLPFALREFEGKAYLDRTQLLIRDVRAVNGDTEITLAADFSMIAQAMPGVIHGRVTNLPITDRLKRLVKPELHKVYDMMHPTGQVDISGTLRYDGFGNWEQHNVLYTVKNGTSQPDPFSYRVQEINGTITPIQEENGDLHYVYRFQGIMGRRPVMMTGTSRPLHQGGEAQFDLWVEQLPIDDTFLSACNPPLRETLETLNLQGKTRAHVRLTRPAGDDQRYRQQIELQLSEGSVEYEKFQYPVDELTADATFDSEKGLWLFTNIAGRHGDAKVTASATLLKNDEPDRLELRVVLEDAPIDHSLERAMRENYQRLWDELNPEGRVTAVTNVRWIPSRKLLDVTMPTIRVRDGSLLMREFRYPMDNVEALLSYADGRVDIREFKATHEETQFEAEGEFLREHGDMWRLRFENIRVNDLMPDRQFRKALPPSMSAGLETLSPSGPITIIGKALEFRGSDRPDTPVTAFWDLDGYFAGIDVIAGVQINHAHGMFSSRGTWDGRIVNSGGTIKLETAYVMGQQLTNISGPYKVHDRTVTVGSVRAFSDPSRSDLSDERLTADAFLGKVKLDAIAKIGDDTRDAYGRIQGEPTRYKVLMELSDLRLEEYARRNLAGNSDLRGVVNGQMELEGTGDDTRNLIGRGAVIIKPAALYQLPIMLQVFQRLSFVPPDNTAFDEAKLLFNVRNEQFEFSEINLYGNSLSLRGRGTVRFDEKVHLEFFSSVPKAQLAIPVVREIVNASSNGWVGVSVTGTISQPVTTVQSNLVLDRAMREFLGTFQPFAPLFPGNGNPNGLPPGASTTAPRSNQTGQAVIRSPR